MSPARALLFFTCGAHALTHLYMLLFTPMLDDIAADFGMDVATLTRYAMISTVLFGVGAVPAGWLGDRLGEKRLLVAFFALTGTGGLMIGLATSGAFLAAGMAVMGMGTSIFHPVGNSLLAKKSPNPGRAMGINGLWGSIGTAAGPLYAGVLSDWSGSWRVGYLSLFVPMLALGYWLAVTRIEDDDPLDQEESPKRPPSQTAAIETAQTESARRATRIPRLTLLLLATTCGGLTFHLITTMLARFAGGESISSLRGGALASLIYLIGGVGQVLAGNLVDRRDGRGLYVLILLISAPLIFLVGLVPASSGPLLTAAGGVMAIALFAVQPVENVLLSRFAPPGRRGFVFGLKFILAFGLGGLGTGLAGTLEARHGMASIFTVSAGVTLLAAALAVGAWKWPER